MQDHRLICKIDQRLGYAEGKRAKASAEATDEDKGLHRSRRLVPMNEIVLAFSRLSLRPQGLPSELLLRKC